LRWLLLILLLIPLAFVGAFFLWPPQVTGMSEAIRQIGFYPVTPPTTLRNPGSIYQISPDGKWYTTLCEIENKRLLNVRRESATEKRVASELTKLTIKADASLLDKAKTSVASDVLKAISYTLDDPKVFEISLANLAEIAAELQASDPSCKSQVEAYLRNGDYVCQIQEVLQATATYKISTDSKASGASNIPIAAVKEVLQSTIEPNATIKSESEIAGSGLFYGMRPTPRCLALPDHNNMLAPVSWLNRVRNKPFGLGFF
jgi:hypothetical protein